MRRSVLVLTTMLALLMAGATGAGAAVSTDQSDYAPGSVVTVSGDNGNGVGYVPGNAVDVSVEGPNGWTSTCTAAVSDDGTWSCQVTLDSDPAVAVGDYSYTATSTAADGSLISESGTFTDANYQTRFTNYGVAPTSVVPGGTMTFTGTLQYGSGTTWTGFGPSLLTKPDVRLYLFPNCTENATPQEPRVALVPSPAYTNGSGNFTFTAPAPSTPGTYQYALRYAGASPLGDRYAATTACLPPVTVNPELQVPDFTFELPDGFLKTYGDAEFSVAGYASKPADHDGAITFARADGSAGCTVEPDGQVTITGPAEDADACKINASLAADGRYSAAGPILQLFHITPMKTRFYGGTVAPTSALPGGSLTFTGVLEAQYPLVGWLGLPSTLGGTDNARVYLWPDASCTSGAQAPPPDTATRVGSANTSESGAFTITATAPSTPGTYYYALRYAGAGGGFYGKTTACLPPVTVAKLGTSVFYTGGQSVILGNTLTASATLTPSACAASQTITYAVEAPVKGSLPTIVLPGTGATGYVIGSATTGSDGKATASIPTAGWSDYVGSIYAIFDGSTTCLASYDEASLMVASAGGSAQGGGWEASGPSNGRLNFGFTVNLVSGTGGTTGVPPAYKGQFVMVNNGAWRLKGTLNTYVQKTTTVGVTGSSDGVGTLYKWVLLDPATNLYGWQKAADNVKFSIAFADNNSGGGKKAASPDTFGIQIQYSASAIPNNKAQPSELKGGDISIKTTK